MEDAIQEYANELRKLIDKSHDAFEKQLNYISSGTLGISMLIIDKIVHDLKSSSCKWMLILSWSLLGATLISNLLSHIFTSSEHGKTLGEINDGAYNYPKARIRNKKINAWNFASILLLLSGIIFLIIFINKNV